MNSIDIVKQYYNNFNNRDWEAMLSLLSDDILHYPNQGELRKGKVLFKEFLSKMDTAYEETLSGIVYYKGEIEGKFAVSFTVNGIYKLAEEGFPPAHGQSYQLPAAAFLEVNNGKINSIKTYYNLEEWIRLVS